MNTEETFYDNLQKLDLLGRDEFYSDLITQEYPIWFNQINKTYRISDQEINSLIQRRGFNEMEAEKFRSLANFLNNNWEAVVFIKHNAYISKHKWEFTELNKLAQSEDDDSVKWNSHNTVVQSHRDGTQYLSVDKALEFAKMYHDRKVKQQFEMQDKFVAEINKQIDIPQCPSCDDEGCKCDK